MTIRAVGLDPIALIYLGSKGSGNLDQDRQPFCSELKGTRGWTKDAANGKDAISLLAPPLPKIMNLQDYDFSDSTGGSDTIVSENAFKRDPGIGGLVLENGTDEPLRNVKVQIYDSKNKRLATVYTDKDGWYMWQYKYTGRPATFTVKLPDHDIAQCVTMKSNRFLVVDFAVPPVLD